VRRPVVRVVGLDLSLTCPAGVGIPDGWELGDWSTLQTFRYQTLPLREGEDRVERLLDVAWHVCHFVKRCRATRVFAEAYAFSRRSSSVTKLAELGGVVRAELHRQDSPRVEELTASFCRKLLLGKLPRRDAKVEVEHRLRKNGAPFRDDNEADAFAVANAGLSECGLPFLSLA
jgi:Holliday junction resolvasome RuvABC endonuclease subunit